MAWIREMFATRRPIAFNRPDWGFAAVDLPETAPQAARSYVLQPANQLEVS
jgi:hypothetical protein